MELIPAILPKHFYDLEKNLEMVIGHVKIVQIDICDGRFIGPATWPFDNLGASGWQDILSEANGMPFWDHIDFELDLMVNDLPEKWDDLVKIGPVSIVIHFPSGREKINELKEFIKNLDPYFKNQMRLGIAFEHNTDVQDILDIQDEISYVQCMGIERVGAQGNPFDETVLERIAFIKSNLPNHTIGIDGAVTLENIKQLKKAGVTRFVVGSAIFHSQSPLFSIEDFKQAIR